jgi:muramidase (phage lysozyme)/LysM repeat protein
MVLIPQYERQAGLQPGGIPSVNVDTSAAQGLANIGGAIANLGDAFQQRQDKQSAFDDQIKLEQHRQETETAFREAQQNMPAGASGFTKTFVESRKPADDAWLATISPQNRDRYAQLWSLDSGKIADSAAQVEYKARGEYEATQLNNSLDTWQTRVRADPSARQAATEDLTHLIDTSTSIDAATKEKFKKTIGASLASAEWLTLYGNDPAAGRRALGLEPAASAVTAKDIPPEGAAFLNAVAGTESPGYDVLNGGERFGSYSDHPRRKGAGGTTTAAGRYQIIAPTWDRARAAVGTTDFSPESQDKAAWWLAQSDYRANTGRDLLSDLKAGNYAQIRRGLGSTWEGLAKTSDTKFAASVSKGGGLPKGEIAGGDPRYADIPYAQRLTLINQAETEQRQSQAVARVDLETRVKDAGTALLTTGRYDGAMPQQQDFIKAYGEGRGQSEYQAFQRIAATGQMIDAVKTMTPAEQKSMLENERPVISGPGFADEMENYTRLQNAVEINQKQRAADPVAYVQSIFPKVKAAWEGATGSAEAFQSALALTAGAQQQIGIPALEQKLLPDNIAKAAVDAFKADTPEAQRIGAVSGIVLATKDPEQQGAIFKQLVAAGLPDMTEGAVRAYARGDQAAGERLMRAAIVDPKDMPGKIAANENDIKQAIQDQVMADGEIGDVSYGISFGQAENLVTAERDSKLLTRAVQLRMVGGEDMDTAIEGTKKDLFGPIKVVDGGGVLATVGEAVDQRQFEAGAEALRPQIETALRSAYRADPSITGSAKAIVDATTENRINDILAQGVFRNVAGGYGFLDPYTNKFVQGADGKPVVFTLDQVMAAGVEKPVSMQDLGPGETIAPKPADPLSDANNPNSPANKAAMQFAENPFKSRGNSAIDAAMGGPNSQWRSDVTSPDSAAPARADLRDARLDMVKRGVSMLQSGVKPDVVDAQMRKAGIGQDLWSYADPAGTPKTTRGIDVPDVAPEAPAAPPEQSAVIPPPTLTEQEASVAGSIASDKADLKSSREAMLQHGADMLKAGVAPATVDDQMRKAGIGQDLWAYTDPKGAPKTTRGFTEADRPSAPAAAPSQPKGAASTTLTGGVGDTPIPAPGMAVPRNKPAAAQTYVVKQGDTLTSIARQFYGSATPANIKKIQKANKIKNANRIAVGRTLTL